MDLMQLLGLAQQGDPEAEAHLRALMDPALGEYTSGVPGTGLDRQAGGVLPPGVGSPGQSFEGNDPNRVGAFAPGPGSFRSEGAPLSAELPEENPARVQGQGIDMRKMWR